MLFSRWRFVLAAASMVFVATLGSGCTATLTDAQKLATAGQQASLRATSALAALDPVAQSYEMSTAISAKLQSVENTVCRPRPSRGGSRPLPPETVKVIEGVGESLQKRRLLMGELGVAYSLLGELATPEDHEVYLAQFQALDASIAEYAKSVPGASIKTFGDSAEFFARILSVYGDLQRSRAIRKISPHIRARVKEIAVIMQRERKQYRSIYGTVSRQSTDLGLELWRRGLLVLDASAVRKFAPGDFRLSENEENLSCRNAGADAIATVMLEKAAIDQAGLFDQELTTATQAFQKVAKAHEDLETGRELKLEEIYQLLQRLSAIAQAASRL